MFQALAGLLILGLVLYGILMFFFGPPRCPEGYSYDSDQHECVNNCAYILNDLGRDACYRRNP